MRTLAILFCALSMIACARPFDVRTAPGFIELKERESTEYAYRATSPEGIVVAVRVVDLEGEGSDDLAFWTRALTLQLRDVNGYALTDALDVRSLDGTAGKQLRFGHDENGKPYVYWSTFWIANHHLVITEAGGVKTTFEKYAPSVEWMIKSVRVR